MASPPPEPLRRFVALFNAGAYWESHEALESAWRRSGSRLYKGLILYASALVHARRGNAHGVRAQLAKALPELARYPDRYLGLDLAAVRCDLAALQRSAGASDSAAWEPGRAGVAPTPLALREAWVRGDEPELG